MADPTTPGKQTSEWLAVIGGVLATVGTTGAALLSKGILDADSIAYVIVASLVSVAGIVAAYINGRSKIKAARALPLAPPPPPSE